MSVPDQNERPNVLLICVDHWSGLLARPAGHPVVMTPTIDQLARNGTRFANAYTTEPSCIPARRSLMTGTTARTHGDRVFKQHEPMPDLPTLAQCFRDGGYQACAVGKLHVYPQRDRIGFDEVILNEEGRRQFGAGADDWELFLADQGFGGQEYAQGLCHNDYVTRPWHLPEACHPTNWTAREMCRMIRRRDPRKPALWYMSFVGPHPPVWPLHCYLDLYRDVELDEPALGDWSRDFEALPHALKCMCSRYAIRGAPAHEVDLGRRAFYATVTHIDHQIRVVIGLLREQGLLENTIIGFVADHGDMLGHHQQWAKGLLYDPSAKIPFILSLPEHDGRLGADVVDDRLAALRDMMPTLLALAGLPIPPTVEGISLAGPQRRDVLYGEHSENELATRMIRDARHKLVYYPTGNVVQLFDMACDPLEQHDRAADPHCSDVRRRLTAALIDHLYGDDLKWVRDGQLIGTPAPRFRAPGTRGLLNQRGLRFM